MAGFQERHHCRRCSRPLLRELQEHREGEVLDFISIAQHCTVKTISSHTNQVEVHCIENIFHELKSLLPHTKINHVSPVSTSSEAIESTILQVQSPSAFTRARSSLSLLYAMRTFVLRSPVGPYR